MVNPKQLEINKIYIYKMYNKGKKRVQEYPVVYWGMNDGIYIFNMLNVEGHFRLTEEQVKEYIKVKHPFVYLLVSTDGYSIEHTKHESLELAREALRKAWDELYDEDMDEDWKEQSVFSEDNAILYQNGENVYVWKIIKVSV